MSERAAQIEALLFALGRSLTREELAKKLAVSKEEIEISLSELTEGGRGVVLVDDGTSVELRVAPEVAVLIERVRKEEYAREIGRAGLEALSAILYRTPLSDGRRGLTRAEIDFIRGVNSAQTLRTLTTRGLVRKVQHPKDERAFLYEPTTELLAYLGVSRVEELPDYARVREKLASHEASYRAAESAELQSP